MSLYNPNKDIKAVRESPTYAFSFMVALAQIICIISAIWLLMESSSKEGFDSLIVLWAVIPALLTSIIAPLNLITGTYYFFKYRDDPATKKWIVGVSMVISVFAIFILTKNQ